MAGDLSLQWFKSPPGVGWQSAQAQNDADEDGEAEERNFLVLGTTLPSGDLLLVGRNTSGLQDLHELIVGAFGWAGAVAAVLAIASGLLVSAGFLRQVEAISRTTLDIMRGDIKRRVPTRGTGDEIDRLSSNFNAMLDRIQSLIEGLREVSSDIAHDLRTPLARMRQRLEDSRMQSDAGSSEYARVVERTIAELDTIIGTFDALLRIAQIEAGTMRAGFSEVDLSAVFRNITEAYGPVAEQSGRVLMARIAPDVMLRGDRQLLTQMISNLIENALRHTPAGTRIDVTLQRTPGAARAVIADNGPGIPLESRSKVLQRFYRLEASRTTPGSGLGLSLAAAVANLHGIAMSLEDNSPGLRVVLQCPTQ